MPAIVAFDASTVLASALFLAFLAGMLVLATKRYKTRFGEFQTLSRRVFDELVVPASRQAAELRATTYEGHSQGTILGTQVDVYLNVTRGSGLLVIFVRHAHPLALEIAPRSSSWRVVEGLLVPNLVDFEDDELRETAYVAADSSLLSRLVNRHEFSDVVRALCRTPSFYGLAAVTARTIRPVSFDPLRAIIGRCLERDARGYAVVLQNSLVLADPAHARSAAEHLIRLLPLLPDGDIESAPMTRHIA